jgi:hypothetical protein
MNTDNSRVFISYRRDTSKYLAQTIFQYLDKEGISVFLDVEGLGPGDFDSNLLEQIAASTHFISLISPDAFKRCFNEKDWVLREIDHANNHGIIFIPVIDEGVDLNKELCYLGSKYHNIFQNSNQVRIFVEYVQAGLERLKYFISSSSSKKSVETFSEAHV